MVDEITLVNGAWFALGGDNLEDITDRHPLGLLHLYSALKAHGYRVNLKDLREIPAMENPVDHPEFIAEFLKDSAPVIGVSCLSHHLPMVISGLEIFSLKNPDTLIILGGMGPGGSPGEILREWPFLGVIVPGEGEHTLMDILSHYDGRGRSLSKVRGIWYRDGDRVICTPPSPRIEDLDLLPIPAYHLVDLRRTRRANLVTSRGCPFSCTFCSASTFWGRESRALSIPRIMEEIAMLQHDLGVTKIRIDDDLFVHDRKRVLQFCRALKSSGLSIEWGCYGRVDRMDRDLLEVMAESGLREIYLGIESGSEEVLRRIGKAFTPEQALQTVKIAAEYVPRIDCFFMWGFPFEEMEDFHKTLTLMVYLKEKHRVRLQYRFLVPYSTTPLFGEFRDSLHFSEEIIAFSDYRFFIRDHYKPMLRRFPEIFSAFHYIQSPDIPEKHRLIKRIFP